MQGPERDLACRLISHLAMWDFDAARALACRSLSDLLEPAPILKHMAEERGWIDLHDRDCESLWMVGAAEKFDPPPTLGMDTSGVLTELLGYSEGEVDALRREGAV